ncbi:MAG TPA: hypothetical protein VMF60_01535 [Acidimicrobiales bacterium]|nr:hypothetical protein [Acidimicrobiales bacterium]
MEASGKITLTTPVILKDCADVTITGGTWDDPNTDPGKGYGGGTGAGRPAFEVVGGTDVTVEDLSIVGANRGGYHSRLAFNGGVETEGTSDLTVSDVKVSHVFGDCLTLDPLRSGAGTNGIVAPVRGLTVDGFSGTACGRQGISLASVDGAVLHDVSIGSTGFDSFDAEADQSGREGVRDLTLDGCAFSGLFAITAGGGATGPITVTDCTMSGTGSGDVLMVRNTSGVPDAGAITLSDDTLRCGASVYVSCFQLAGASDVMVEKSTVTIGYRHDAIHEAAYHLSGATHVTFVDDTVAGFGRMGTVGAGSNATVSGGTWKGLSCRAAAVCPAR